MDEPTPSMAKRFWRSLGTKVGVVIVFVVLLCALFAEYLAPYSPTAFVSEDFSPPSLSHWFGTDVLGRDLLTRVIHGARTSLTAGLLSVALAVLLGATGGALAGYFGGWIDTVVMRLVDMMMSFPGVLIALMMWTAFGASQTTVMIAVGIINIPTFARQVRASVLNVRHTEYVLAAQAMGAGPLYILRRVIFPAILSPIIVLGTLTLGAAILEVAGLSFLGMSGQPDVPEWGNMLNEARQHFQTSIWPAIAPGVAISLTVIGFNLLGDGLRDAFDTRG